MPPPLRQWVDEFTTTDAASIGAAAFTVAFSIPIQNVALIVIAATTFPG